MDGDWKGNVGARGSAVGERAGGGLTDWYLERTRELGASSEFMVAQDRHYDMLRARVGAGDPPSANGHGANSPWEALKGLGFNIQEMVTQERELRATAQKEADETKAALYKEQADRLREQIEGLRQEFRDYVEGKGPQGGGGRNAGDVGGDRPKTLEQRLGDLVIDRLGDRFLPFLLGEGSSNGNAHPADPADVVIQQLTMGNKIREALGLPLPGAGRPGVPTDGSMRADLLRLVLEDDRERYRIDKDHETNTHRTGILRDLKDTVREHLGEGIQAIRDWNEHSKEGNTGGEGDEGTPAADGEKPSRWRVFCPNEGCGKANTFNEPPAQEMTCSWCGRSMQVAV